MSARMAGFLPPALYNNSREKPPAAFGMSIPTAFKSRICFHEPPLLDWQVVIKKLRMMSKAMNDMLKGNDVQLEQYASDALTKSRSLGRLRIVIQRCMCFKSTVIRNLVLLHRADGYVLVNQAKSLFESRALLLGHNSVDDKGRDRYLELDDAIRLLS